MPDSEAIAVAVVAFDRISPFHLSVPCVVFEPRSDPRLPRYTLTVCAAEPGPLRTNAGFEIVTPHGLDALARADIVIVPSWRDPAEAAPPGLVAALQAAHARGAQLVGLCLGAFVLAEAGLLDGLGATTHWMWAEDFARRFPAVRLDAEVLYVDEGRILTSAGTAAGIDCCLHLLRERHGAEVANQMARRLVTPAHRQGGQAQYVERPVAAEASPDRLAETLQWAGTQLHRPLDLDTLAARAAMSRRTFTRRFRQVTGTTPGNWLAGQRLLLAQRLLEAADTSIDEVAERAGFGTAASLRQQFARVLRTSPSAYRRTFRAG